MDVIQDAFVAVFGRDRKRDDRDEESEAIVSVLRRIAPLFPNEHVGRHSGAYGRALHYGLGCGFALAYAALRARRPEVAAGKGLAFGAALWLLSDVILIPLEHLGRPWWRYSLAERANAVASHLAYAVTVEAFLRP